MNLSKHECAWFCTLVAPSCWSEFTHQNSRVLAQEEVSNMYMGRQIRRTSCGKPFSNIYQVRRSKYEVGQSYLEHKKSILRTSVCTWCSKYVPAILKVMEKRGVSIGMFQTSYLSFDVRRTECVGQTMLSMMIPVWKIRSKSCPLQNLNFGIITLDISQRVEELGIHFNLRRKMCMRDVCAGGCLFY